MVRPESGPTEDILNKLSHHISPDSAEDSTILSHGDTLVPVLDDTANSEECIGGIPGKSTNAPMVTKST